MKNDGRRTDLDFIKGIAIIAVVLYHMEILKSGYLGVDIFLVVTGYLSIPKLIKTIKDEDFSYNEFIIKKLKRFAPSIIVVSAFCLIIGMVAWLPDDLENLAQTVIASNFFSENILSAITTGNYWDSINDIKPLMHLWYVGIIMEFYMLFPIIMIILRKIAVRYNMDQLRVLNKGVLILCIISLSLFSVPFFSDSNKFYFLPFRTFELCSGGMFGIVENERKNIFRFDNKFVSVILFLIYLASTIFIYLFSFNIDDIGVKTTVVGVTCHNNSNLILPNTLLVIITVVMTVIYIGYAPTLGILNRVSFFSKVGIASYSIYVWHQAVLALYRYSFGTKISITSTLAIVIGISVLSFVNYYFIERWKIQTIRSRIIVSGVFVTVIIMSIILYIRAGVVRDVPELDIYKTNIHRNMHSEYCDRIYEYDNDFTNDSRTKVLVIGNSFARDFGNIILESKYSKDIDLSYIYCSAIEELNEQKSISRLKKADYVFLFGDRASVPDFLWKTVKNTEIVYGIGTKNFGLTNGNIYIHRFDENYYSRTVVLNEDYMLLNNKWDEDWGLHYVDLIKPVEVKDGEVRVFTADGKYISQDCEHLTRAGAIYYANIINFDDIFFE